MTEQAKTNSKIEARHAEVLGQPPRIAPLDRAVMAEQVQADTDSLIGRIAGRASGRPTLPLDAIPEIMFTLCRYPDLWQSLMDITVQLQGPNSVLPPRDRKLAILRTGWLCQAPYEFGEHLAQAKRLGFATQELERVATGSAAREWSDHERAILRAVEELHEGAMVSDETWNALAKTFDDQQMFELLVLVGQFTATAYFQNGIRLRLEANNRGLEIS